MVSDPSAARVPSKAASAASKPCAPLLSLLVTNTSDLSRALRAIASPTCFSLPYISAVSMCR